MILPNIRASFGQEDADLLVRALAKGTRHNRRRWADQLAREGLDALLDHPEALAAVLTGDRISAMSPRLVFYLMVRHTLLESGLDDENLADYVASLLIEFAVGGRAHKIAPHDDKTYHYIVDIVTDLEEESSERRQFLLRAHLGNYSLWLSGLFPDYVVARVHRKGAPGIGYYEDLGATGYRLASECGLAGQYDVARIYRDVAGRFRPVRRALNMISDRYFFRSSPSPLDRLLRQVIDSQKPND